jgi:hypothetical protein
MFVLSLYAFFRRLRLFLGHDSACHQLIWCSSYAARAAKKITRPPLNLMHPSAALPVTGTGYSVSVAYRQSQALHYAELAELYQDSNH